MNEHSTDHDRAKALRCIADAMAPIAVAAVASADQAVRSATLEGAVSLFGEELANRGLTTCEMDIAYFRRIVLRGGGRP